jgi:two-component system, sensor histidine kinase YesM
MGGDRMFKLNIFRKIVLMLILILLPIVVLYAISTRISMNVVQKQIYESNLDQLTFLMNQLDTNIEQLSMFPVLLSYDPSIRDYIDRRSPKQIEALIAESRIREKLSLQSVANSWQNELTILFPEEFKLISSSPFRSAHDDEMNGPIYNQWTYIEEGLSQSRKTFFVLEIGEPAREVKKELAEAVFQVRFNSANIAQMLDTYKMSNSKNNDPFLYHPQEKVIFNSTSSVSKTQTLVQLLNEEKLASDSGQKLFKIDQEEYLVNYVKSKQLGWYLVDYTPYESIIEPIRENRNFMFAIVVLLLIMAVTASFMLYRNVQRPLEQLISKVQRIKNGDFSARINYQAKNEFDYLINDFNEMAKQIQILIEDVYTERIHSREAILKQLQSQINPHFLYNSLFFIINSAVLEDRKSVIKMAESLAQYCRYATRVENQSVTVYEEVELVRSYLTIITLRMNRLEYEIDLPEQMMELKVPRLILQPIVENAIVHGIENNPSGGFITITGKQDEYYNYIFVEDDGLGMTTGQLIELLAKLNKPMSSEVGCGTWNVNQRLLYQFGKGSGLIFEQLPSSGLRTTIKWARSVEITVQHEDTKGDK